MKFKFFIVPSVLIFNLAGAQNSSTSLTIPQGTVTTVSAASLTPVTPAASTPSPASTGSAQVLIVDYESVYEAATIEEEVQMATERFNLTQSQQDVWLAAAADRRVAEKQFRDKVDSKATDYDKESVYRGLKSSQNTFYETIIGYLNPAQKQAMETDRWILEEKRKKIAKLPPPIIAPTVTVAPVDSAAIKEPENTKGAGKKKTKKKKKGA